MISLDVARGQLDWGLRNDDRVDVVEHANARDLRGDDLAFEPELATIDVSFIALAKVLPAVARCLAAEADLLGLVKPQFELDRARVGKGGVVRDPDDRREALRRVAETATSVGLTVAGFASSGLPGPKGNRETFIWCRVSGGGVGDLEAALREVQA